jgi:hypothetical protein
VRGRWAAARHALAGQRKCWSGDRRGAGSSPDWGGTQNRPFNSVPYGRPQFNTRTCCIVKEFPSRRGCGPSPYRGLIHFTAGNAALLGKYGGQARWNSVNPLRLAMNPFLALKMQPSARRASPSLLQSRVFPAQGRFKTVVSQESCPPR